MSIATTAAPAGLLTRLSAAAIRPRCRMVHDWVAAGRSRHFALDETRMPAVAAAVAGEIRTNYPDLDIPPHSRWRHFSAGGIDRWERLVATSGLSTERERVRAAIDLAVVSVLLDAGAGAAWRYREEGRDYARSEGLALASLAMFRDGVFSSDPARPLRVDGPALRSLDREAFAAGFQHSDTTPLAGFDERLELLRRFGACLAANPGVFGPAQRPGRLLDGMIVTARRGVVAGETLIDLIVTTLAPIWPAGLNVGGEPLGDVGRHAAIVAGGASRGLVPFHKLSQWLTYSLIEPLSWAGLVVDTAALTGLPEYRNGGLLVDLGVIVPRQAIDPAIPQDVAGQLVVEWRALTVVLLDRLLPLVRTELGTPALTMAQMLQGGTWSAGRAAAQARRPGGVPPIGVAATGTVF